MKEVIFDKKSKRQTEGLAKDGFLSSLSSMINDATGYDLSKSPENLFNIDEGNLKIAKFFQELLRNIKEIFN